VLPGAHRAAQPPAARCAPATFPLVRLRDQSSRTALCAELQLLLPDRVRFSCCSPIASASAAAPHLRPLQLATAVLEDSSPMPKCNILDDDMRFARVLPTTYYELQTERRMSYELETVASTRGSIKVPVPICRSASLHRVAATARLL